MEKTIFVEDGNLVFKTGTDSTEKMNLDRLEELRLQWEVSRRLNDVIRSYANLGVLVITRQGFRIEEIMGALESMVPDSDTIYMLSLLSEAFGKTEQSTSKSKCHD